MSSKESSSKFPTLYINHGGGPFPLMGREPDIAQSLKTVAGLLPKPRAIVVISAHFEAKRVTLMTSAKPSMYFDYYGFPPETYRYKYDARSDSAVVSRIEELLSSAAISYDTDGERGFDHGIFVPLLLMYPKADVPVIGISQPSSFDTDVLWRLGQALAPLREDGVLFLGSGSSFHNFDAFRRPEHDVQGRKRDIEKSRKFDAWLQSVACLEDADEREARLRNWRQAPCATFAHPREEHFTPLLVVAAAGGRDKGRRIEQQDFGGLKTSQFLFG